MTVNTTCFDTFLRAVEKAGDRKGVLGDDYLVFPPEPDFGYESTPQNALTFAAMGVDGVHFAILKINGEVTDQSPVIHVSPMDGEPYAVLGDCFLNYLAAACGASIAQMQQVIEEERLGRGTLIPFVRAQFDHSRLYDDQRFAELSRHLNAIELKPEADRRGF